MVKDDESFGSGGYTAHVYVVEARATCGAVVLHADQHNNPMANIVLTPHEWKRVHVDYGPVGVPNRMDFYAEAVAHHFLTYACAMAMAYWLQASQSGIETRLVQVEFKSSYSTRRLGYSEPVDTFEADRQLLWKLQADRKREEAPAVDAVAKGDEVL